jgi:protease I
MAKVLMVVAEKDFRDEEFKVPYELIKTAGHSVTIASSAPGTAHGRLGMRVTPDTVISAVDPSDYDALVIAGGSGCQTYLWSNKPLLEAVKKVYEKGGVVAAICIAPAVLARAGIIKGRRCTVFQSPEAISEMEKGGCVLQGKSVVVDGRIATANGPAAAKAFGEAIIKLLKK